MQCRLLLAHAGRNSTSPHLVQQQFRSCKLASVCLHRVDIDSQWKCLADGCRVGAVHKVTEVKLALTNEHWPLHQQMLDVWMYVSNTTACLTVGVLCHVQHSPTSRGHTPPALPEALQPPGDREGRREGATHTSTSEPTLIGNTASLSTQATHLCNSEPEELIPLGRRASLQHLPGQA